MINAPISHQFMFLNMLFEKMEPRRERMLMAQNISPKLTARNAMQIAFAQMPLSISFAPQIILRVSTKPKP